MKRFGNNPPAVDDVSLEVPRGSFTTLLGPSGCGKTTTLRMIAGFYEPDGGDIYLGDRRINDVPAHRRGTAMVFQDYALFPHMSVAQNVGYGLKLAGVRGDELRRRVAETLKFLGLLGLEERSPNQLSGGQQQRVALARALVMNPEVLLLDEPLSNLDAKLRVSIRDELMSIQQQLGITTIYVTHDQQEALAMSDWVAVMNRGKVVQWGTPWEIYYRPRTPFMADFVGSVNLVRAAVQSADGETARVRVGEQDLAVAVHGPTPRAGSEAVLSIRPESLRLASPTDARADDGIAFVGEVVRRVYLGQEMRYTVAIAGQEWIVDRPDPGASPLLGGEVVVWVNPSRIHVIPDMD
ncbi:MAG: ABC transporter ATP-binding protein [Chloroflexi bacterium]|nr:ABC transporter ATP-binding protein [Chloroflexota bacterium]